MWKIGLICVGILGVCQAYSETKTGKGYSSASSGTGAYAGGGTYGTGVPFPIPPFLGSATIGNQLAQYVEDLQKQHFATKTPCNPQHISASRKNSRGIAASSSGACGHGRPHRTSVSGHPVGFSGPAALNSGMSMTSTTGAATAHASSALHPDELFQQQFQHQQSLFNQIHSQASGASGGYGGGGSYGSSGSGGYGGGYGGSGSYGGGSGYGGSFGGGYGGSGGSGYPNYASSSASFGPGGVHQTASISPANPAIPNVNTRFDSGSSGGPGFVGVSTSSFSESSDVDGYKSDRRGAVTSVNDNGKVSTYYTHS